MTTYPISEVRAAWLLGAMAGGCAYAAWLTHSWEPLPMLLLGAYGLFDNRKANAKLRERPGAFLAKLEVVRQSSNILLDLEESVGDLTCGLASIYDDFSCTVILLRAFQERQGMDDDRLESERAP